MSSVRRQFVNQQLNKVRPAKTLAKKALVGRHVRMHVHAGEGTIPNGERLAVAWILLRVRPVRRPSDVDLERRARRLRHGDDEVSHRTRMH